MVVPGLAAHAGDSALVNRDPLSSGGRAILFWFYKDLGVCRNRLRLLRANNPTTKIFGLFGGDISNAELFREGLNELLDDFYSYSDPKSPEWKWKNGDLLITDWYRNRGIDLTWTSLTIVQWDMILLEPIDRLFAHVPESKLLLSGLRSIAKEGGNWHWVSDPAEKIRFEAFQEYFCARLGPIANPMFCIFIVVVFPREFLAAYAYVEEPELGFIEYRVPIMAQRLGFEFATSEMFVVSDAASNRRSAVITVGDPIPLITILWNRYRRNGARLFHPFYTLFPSGFVDSIGFLVHLCKSIPGVTTLLRLRDR